MFHEHRVDVTSHLKTGINKLGIIFESALNKGREEVAKQGNLMCWNGESSRLYIRKAQYHWGWDWGAIRTIMTDIRSCVDVCRTMEAGSSGNLRIPDW